MFWSDSTLRRSWTFDLLTARTGFSKVPCSRTVFWALAVCCLLYWGSSPNSSSKSLQLQRQNASLAQAASLSRQLRELSLGHFSHRTLSHAFRIASQPVLASQPSTYDQHATDSYEHTAEFDLLVTKASKILSDLSKAKPVATCSWDTTLPLKLQTNGKVLLAANMHNNEDLLPHFTLQMLHLLASIPTGTAFLSIYESGSSDSTGTSQVAVSFHAKLILFLK